MANLGRRLVPTLLLFSGACSNDSSTPSGWVQPGADTSHDERSVAGDDDGESDYEEEPEGCVRAGEFGACRDADPGKPKPDEPEPDAGCTDPSNEFGDCTENAGSKFDAGVVQPDAGSTESNPCQLGKERACDGRVFGKVQTAGAQCDVWFGTSLRVRFTTCENCGAKSFLAQGELEVRDCGGCDTVYGVGFSDNISLAPNACTMVDRYTTLTQTEVDPSCFDVYGVTYGFTAGENPVYQEGSRYEARLCRCSLVSGTCKSCANGACDELP